MNYTLIKQTAKLETPVGSLRGMLKRIEEAGRTCYKSEPKGQPEKFIAMIIKRGHESVLEHGNVTIRFVCDRGISHEIVRHRIASPSQESTRYVNYANRGIGIVNPFSAFGHLKGGATKIAKLVEIWTRAMEQASQAYLDLIEAGAPPELARSVLPNSTKTELVLTANFRSWRNFLTLRTSKAAHPQMREVANQVYDLFNKYVPVIVADLEKPEALK